MLDVLFLTPNSAAAVYQGLADKWAAIEPPTWALLLAEACRSKGYEVAILDCLALNLNVSQAVAHIVCAKPRLVCFVTYGPNPNSGTTQMVGTLAVAKTLKDLYPEYRTLSIGSHTSALPQEVLAYDCIDFVAYNEGVRATIKLVEQNFTELDKIPGIGYKENGFQKLTGGAGSIIPTELMDVEMPGYAWDLLPDLKTYRAHNWHVHYDETKRSPFAAIYASSLGCVKKCSFCMINSVNRINPEEGTHAAHSAVMRYWSPEWTLRQIRKLRDLGVNAIRFSDELFFVNRRYYEPILTGLKQEYGDDPINFWAYTRADTVKPQFLELFRDAGCQWLAVGVESGSQTVREEITKGSFKDINIRDIAKRISDYGINRGFNYIFGLPPENYGDMQVTLDLAIELNTEFANFYHSVPLPGSPLYYECIQNGWEMPSDFEAYSFHSYNAHAMPTRHLTGAEVLAFRDSAWRKYFERPEFLSMIEQKFGKPQADSIREQSKVKLKRKILGHYLVGN
jgi:anaerobic magnesium-protoporphyrin IX monomethyl ester cyclase